MKLMKLTANLFVTAAAFVAVSASAPASVLASPAAALSTRAASPAGSAHLAVAPTAPTSGAVVPATTLAPATPLNLASDRTALNAYAAYLTAVLREIPSAQENDASFVAGVAAQCKSALEPLTQSGSLSPSVQQTLTVLGEEMGDDLAIDFDTAAFTPFLRLSTVLSHLRWSRTSMGSYIVRHFITTETNVLDMAPTDLCQNALLAGTSPQIVPALSRSFVKSYAKASTEANAALSRLVRLMESFQTASERAVLTRITELANQVAKLTRADLAQSGSSLSTALESI